MASWSKWELHPDLAQALASGIAFDDWLDGRKPCGSLARISRDKQEEIGVARQHRNNDEFAALHGCAIIYRYTDNDITAADPDIERPAFLRMVRDLRARRVEEGYPLQGIFVVEEERAVRLPEDYLRLHRALTVDEHGLFAIKDTNTVLDVHSDAEIIRGLVTSAMGEKEVKKTKRRVGRNVKDMATEGKSVGRRRFGWQGANIKKDLRTNEKLEPKEAKVYREGIDLRLKGKGWPTVRDHFIASPFKTVRGKEWTIDAVKYLLTNPAICGYRMYNGELVRDPKTGEPVVGNWETIATPEEWERLVRGCTNFFNLDGIETPQYRFQKKVREQGRKNYRAIADAGRKYHYSPYLRCGKPISDDGDMCLGHMNGAKPNGTNTQGVYKCGKCRGVARRIDLTDEAIERVVVKVLEEQFATLAPEEKSWYGEDTLKALIAKRQELKDAQKSGVISLGEYIEFKDANEEQIAESQKDRDDFYAEQAARNFLAGFSEEKWAGFDMRQKRKAIEAVLQAVIVLPIPKGRPKNAPFDPKLLRIIWRTPH